MSASINSSQIATPEAPWLGLRSFTEDAQDYFFGRRAELEDLYERILDKPLTILFGQSGLGKSSLLQAALIPRLRTGGFLPVLVRFNHEADAASLDQQMIEQLKEALISAEFHEPVDAFTTSIEEGTTRADWDPAAFLWLLFHDPAYGFIPHPGESAAPLPRPVFLIDQFEEIFTLGERPARRAVSLAFHDGLASLIENRPPASLRGRLEEDDELVERLVYQARHARVLLSLREDFLHVLERWHGSMPSLMENRFELRMLSGPQAFEAVVRPGQLRPTLPPIIPDEVGQAIVRFVAGAKDDVPLAEIDAVPPLLSLVCAELNAQRLSSREQQITRAQFEGHSDEILQSFYLRSFDLVSYGGTLDGIPDADVALKAVKRLIEDRLLSPDGYRESIAYDTVARDLSKATTPQTAKTLLDEIVERRLLTVEERGGVRRLELAHDVLTPIVRFGRDERQENEALAQAKSDRERAEAETRSAVQQRNRLRRWVALSLLLALLGITAAVTARVGLQKARKATEREKQATAQAISRFESAFAGFKAIYEEYNAKIVGNTKGLTMKEADILGSGLRAQLLPQLERLHREQPNHRGCIDLISRLTLDEILTIRRQTSDWPKAKTLREEAIAKLTALKDPSVQEIEAYAELLLWRPLISSLEGKKDLTREQDQELIPQLSKLRRAYPDSWRLSYIEVRLQNNLLSDENASTDAFLAIAQKFNQLVDRSGRNYDVVLWEFVTTVNAYFEPENWKRMPLAELQRMITMFDDYFLQENRYNLLQTEIAANAMRNFMKTAARSLIPSKDANDLKLRQDILRSLDRVIAKLEARLSRSPIVYARRGEYYALEIDCLNAGLSVRKMDAIQLALSRHRERASAIGVVDSIRDTVAEGFQKYSAQGADQSAKDEALRQIQSSLPDIGSLELSGFDALVTDDNIARKLFAMKDMSSQDPLFPVCSYLLERYIEAFSKAGVETRRVYLEGFSGKTQELLKRWNTEKEREKIIQFWDRCYSGIQISQETAGDRSGFVFQGKIAAVTNINAGNFVKGIAIYAETASLCEKILTERPWDWYLRQESIALQFDMADALEEAAEKPQAEMVGVLRREGWRLLVELTGAEIDLTKFKVLPKRGGIPPGATADESKFFSRFKSVEQGGSSMKMFVIPCDVNGAKVPVQFYILSGKAGYQGLLDQFRWIKEYRGVSVSPDIQECLQKLSASAAARNVDFHGLATLAFDYLYANTRKKEMDPKEPSKRQTVKEADTWKLPIDYTLLPDFLNEDIQLKSYPKIARKTQSSSDNAQPDLANAFSFPGEEIGEEVTIHLVIETGEEGYRNLLDQLRWVALKRGITLRPDVRDSLRKLNDIAVENNVNFMDLCKYALERPRDSKPEKPSATAQDRLQTAMEAIKSAEATYAKSATNQNKRALAEAYNVAADSGLYVQRWKDVETWARKSLELTPTEASAYGNLATALLFLGKYAEALKVFRAHWNDRVGGGTLAEATYRDFEQLAKQGITHPDIARLRAALPSPKPKPRESAAPSAEASDTQQKRVPTESKGVDPLPLTPEEKQRFKDEEVVLLLSGVNSSGDKIYNYVKLKLDKVRSLVTAVETGSKFDINEYGEVIASGLGEPTAEIKAKIETQYKMINFPKDKNATPPK